MSLMADEFIDGQVENLNTLSSALLQVAQLIPQRELSEPSKEVASQCSTPKTTRKRVALTEVDVNVSLRDEPPEKPKEQKKEQKIKPSRRSQQRKGATITQHRQESANRSDS